MKNYFVSGRKISHRLKYNTSCIFDMRCIKQIHNVDKRCLGHYAFILFEMSARIRFEPRITKPFFFCQRAHQIVADFRKKQSISGDKKHFKTKFMSRDKKYFSGYVFFVALISFFKIGQKFFYLVALINFSRNLSNVSFFLNVFFSAHTH